LYELFDALLIIPEKQFVLTKFGKTKPETVHNVMMMPQNRRRHADGVSDNNVDMT
jgi:hypothetical protein